MAKLNLQVNKDTLILLLSIAMRGGFKLGVTLLTVAIFVGIITATQNIASSYAMNAPIIKQISSPPLLAVYREACGGSLKVEVANILVGDVLVMVVSPSNTTRYLSLINANGDSIPLKIGEALISRELLPSTLNDTIEVGGFRLRIRGVIQSSTALSKIVVVSPETMDTLGIETEEFYFRKLSEAESTGYVEAPSSINLIQGITLEVQDVLSAITCTLYATLVLTCLMQGLYAMNECKGVLKVFSVIGSSRGLLYSSLVALAIIVSAVSVVLGYAIGFVASASTSAVFSLVLDIPYIKPSVSNAFLWNLALALFSSSIGLSVGYVRGYALACSV